MTDYIILMFAVVLFTAQFSFTKLYEGELGQNLNSALIMLVVTSSVGALLFLATGGFSVEITEISIIYAVALAFIMIPYYLIGIKVLSLGSLAIYSMLQRAYLQTRKQYP